MGTPQGGTLSPLLANIALDGMEKRLYEELRNKVRIIRFADDFVVFSDKLENVLASKKILAQYLKPTRNRKVSFLRAKRATFDFQKKPLVNRFCPLYIISDFFRFCVFTM